MLFESIENSIGRDGPLVSFNSYCRAPRNFITYEQLFLHLPPSQSRKQNDDSITFTARALRPKTSLASVPPLVFLVFTLVLHLQNNKGGYTKSDTRSLSKSLSSLIFSIKYRLCSQQKPGPLQINAKKPNRKIPISLVVRLNGLFERFGGEFIFAVWV